MKILGISASGRKSGMTSEVVSAILEASKIDFEFISLGDKTINGCTGCTGCAKDNKCKQDDDWIEIGNKMLEADAIVFGAPNYYGTINALGHACLERTFCFRHREAFLLSGKLGVIVTADGGSETPGPSGFVEKIMKTNLMPVVDTVNASGYSQCYTCGFGHDCAAGGVIYKHGYLDQIEDKHLPQAYEKQEKTVFNAYRIGKMLGSMLRNKK